MALFGAAGEGWLFFLRWFHFLAGITWIGMLYYFNFVQTPFFATAEPAVRTGMIAGSLVGLGGDTASTVGSATVEMEALDPISYERLAAAVDQRAGTKVLFAKRAYETWGDVQAACDYWVKRLAWRLAEFGVQLKPGAQKPEEPKEGRSV